MRMELINKIIGDIVMKLNQNAQFQIEIYRKLGKSSMTMVTIYLILSTYLFIFQTNVFGSSSICNLEYRTLICFFNLKKTTTNIRNLTRPMSISMNYQGHEYLPSFTFKKEPSYPEQKCLRCLRLF